MVMHFNLAIIITQIINVIMKKHNLFRRVVIIELYHFKKYPSRVSLAKK